MFHRVTKCNTVDYVNNNLVPNSPLLKQVIATSCSLWYRPNDQKLHKADLFIMLGCVSKSNQSNILVTLEIGASALVTRVNGTYFPPELRDARLSLPAFKSLLKTHLFKCL